MGLVNISLGALIAISATSRGPPSCCRYISVSNRKRGTLVLLTCGLDIRLRIVRLLRRLCLCDRYAYVGVIKILTFLLELRVDCWDRLEEISILGQAQ